jgi:predicted nucleic acid-binding protein
MQIDTDGAPCELPLTFQSAVIVLDTNVVLDWLLFADSALTPLATAVTNGRLRWLATAAMRGELCAVLGRGLAATRGIEPDSLLKRWDALVHLRPTAAPHALRCSDHDDQKFVDLAFSSGARWLVTRDRALLKLARRTIPLGLTVVTPAQWNVRSDAP